MLVPLLCRKTVSVSMLQLKYWIDSVCPTQGDSQEPCPPCQRSSYHHNSTYNPSQKGQFQRGKCMFSPDFYYKYTVLSPTTIWGHSPSKMSFTPAVTEVQQDIRHANLYCFPFTYLHLKQHWEVEREGRIMSIIRFCVINTVVLPFPTTRSTGGCTILTALSLYVIKRHKAS